MDIRKMLACTIILTWSFCTTIIILLMILNFIDVSKAQDILKTFSSVSSGFIGMVLGYYFSGSDKKV